MLECEFAFYAPGLIYRIWRGENGNKWDKIRVIIFLLAGRDDGEDDNDDDDDAAAAVIWPRV